MLSKPCHGWTIVQIGLNSIGTASYIEDVPMDLLDTFIAYFNQKTKYLPFSFVFDAEGSHFGIIEFNDGIYYTTTEVDAEEYIMKPINPDCIGLTWFERSDKVLKKLASDIINDIKTYITEWVYWMDDEDTLGKTEAKCRKKMLLNKCDELEKLITV